ncbi:MAG: hypothetical protein FJ333_02620 [Sphingomonadales bacterium]|nr:hypothetical protein [Sphingomonadales bacterium]
MPVHNFLSCLVNNSPQTQDIRTMKSLFFAIATFTTACISAQNTPQFKPQAGDWSTEAAFYAQTGNSFLRAGLNDIKVRKFTTDRKAIRLRMLAIQNNETTVIVGTQGTMERSIKEGKIFIAPGFEKHLDGSKRLSPYWGQELVLGKSFYQYNLTNSSNGQTFSQGGTFNTKTTGAFSLGTNTFVGLDYHLGSKIFVGLEVGYGILYQQYGESVVTVSNNGSPIDNKSVPMGTNFALTLFSNPGIRLGIAF